eukprot:evm.model.scf_3859.2 EVM.evm.TU.scf_3859.2   scf_3859:2896-7405(-)
MGTGLAGDSDVGGSPTAAVTRALESMGCTVFYQKPLTSSDANGSGRVVVPKAVAEQYFPHLDNQAGVPIEAADTLGNKYTFRFRFWINNQSRMYLLEGVSEMHQRYDLKVGDVMIFAHLPDSSLIVAGRPMTEEDSMRKPPLRRVNNPQSGVKRDLQKRASKPTPKSSQSKRLQKRRLQGDGVFRAIPDVVPQPESKVFSQHGVWTATIEIVGGCPGVAHSLPFAVQDASPDV